MMVSQEELQRPLGVPPGPPKRGRGPALAGLAVLLLAGAGVLGWQGGWLAPSEAPAPVADSGSSTPQGEPPGPAVAPAVAQAPDEARPDEPALPAEPLEPLEPDSRLEPVAPPVERRPVGLSHLPDPALSERGATGIIPRRGPDGRRPMDAYARPPATEGNFGVARIVLIVGGIGISQTASKEAVERLPPAVTLAFAPSGNSLQRWMEAARRKGHELLLQVPMQPVAGGSPGPHTLTTEADPLANIADLHWAMSRLTNYVGVVNYQGGRLLAAPDGLRPVLTEIAARGLLFVDDGTARASVAPALAPAVGLPFVRADIQIDAIRDPARIDERLAQLATEARRTGRAVGVASAFPETIDRITRFAQNASAQNIEITPVSAVVEDASRTR